MRVEAPYAALLALVAALVAVLVAPARPASADDVVVLANDARLSGRIVSEDAKSVVLERSLGGGRTTMTIPKDRIRSIERDPASRRTGASPPSAARPEDVRDEWFLLQSGGQVVGTRHLLVLRLAAGAGASGGWRLEEQVRLFAASHLPGVRVQRIEDVDAHFLPTSLHYREVGDAGGGPGDPSAYETLRQGPVEDGVWKATEHEAGRARDLPVPVPAGARGPLAARESLARTWPRAAGLASLPIVDAARGAVRLVRTGFSSVGGTSAAGEPEDVLRWEDGETVLESRWAPATKAGEPPRCLSEQVAAGVLAVAATAAQAEAAEAKATAEAPPREWALADVGIALTLPGASWVGEAIPTRATDVGARAVGRVQSKLLASDVRVEWDPKGASPSAPAPTPASAETALLARLRALAPDVAVVEPRTAVAALPGAWRMTIEGTVRGERVRTLVLVAERGEGRATLLAASPVTAWKDARGALDAILASFRWL